MRPIFPSKMSGEEGWCLKVANRLSTTEGWEVGCLGGGVREWSTLEDEEDEATFRREPRSSSGGGGMGGSCNEKIMSGRSHYPDNMYKNGKIQFSK